jgi:hypothetical protein
MGRWQSRLASPDTGLGAMVQEMLRVAHRKACRTTFHPQFCAAFFQKQFHLQHFLIINFPAGTLGIYSGNK